MIVVLHSRCFLNFSLRKGAMMNRFLSSSLFIRGMGLLPEMLHGRFDKVFLSSNSCPAFVEACPTHIDLELKSSEVISELPR